MRRDILAALMLVPLLAACGGGTAATAPAARPQSASAVPAPVRKPARPVGVSATVHMMPGLETVIGATPADLSRQFGPPRLDVQEGDARKLQYAGQACVLDVYLYPSTSGGNDPTATYVDARRASDGKDVDRAACVAALKGG